MPFVKLDCGMLDSSIWPDREARALFITALLMADPFEVERPEKTFKSSGEVDESFVVPVGWYGRVSASGSGIIRRCGIDEQEGFEALYRLAQPDPDSRTPDYEGRRMVRVDGGYLILNFDRHRRRDHSAAERQRRYRLRLKESSPNNNVTSHVTTSRVTQAEGEGEAQDSNSSPQSVPSEPPLASPPPSATAAGDPAGAVTSTPKKKPEPVDSRPWPPPTPELQPFSRWWTPAIPPMHRAAQRRFVEDFDAYMQTLDAAYPHVDLQGELAKAYAWEEARGAKTPKGRKAFLRNWIERAANSYQKPMAQQPYGQAIPR